MRKLLVSGAAGLVAVALAQPVTAEVAQVDTAASVAQVGTAASVAQIDRAEVEATEYVVVFDEGATVEEARAAVVAAGGTIVEENLAVGVATVRSADPGFLAGVARSDALVGAARHRPIGHAEPQLQPKPDLLEELPRHLPAARAATAAQDDGGLEPLSHHQWNLDMIDADEEGSFSAQRGDPGVLVGIIDTGIDATHPDIVPSFSHELSRNFTVDIPLVDGPCEEEADQRCTDPADVDESGHGTHVGGIVAAPINDLGIAGVAPVVTLVNLRAGQDSGYFFLQPTVDALVYAADHGVDVVNMSYYTDPWLYLCADNPADSPEAQMEQRTIIEATQRALRYARDRHVTLVSSIGNNFTDLGHPVLDDTSPDFPPDSAYERQIDNSCISLPTEGEGVIAVTGVGPSTRKAYYSSYGVEQADVAAPGGDYRDFPGTDLTRRPENLILSAYPASLLVPGVHVDETGEPISPFFVRDCREDDGTCAYYGWFQGTSMAGPHAAGVAALIVSEYGWEEDGGRELWPAFVEDVLTRTATDFPCPSPPTLVYPDRPDIYTATCEGTFMDNGFYGEGIVNAARAVNPYYRPEPR